jgi:hypothetical protein
VVAGAGEEAGELAPFERFIVDVGPGDAEPFADP